ncbi:MAG TPA: hypothetical protein VNA69_02960 [Thermoanaerobaculia bacterium]|nr:hypothetical protein [Thermoanaerobaculia bacterium]
MAALLAAALLIAGCKGEEEYAEADAFSFVVYPGSRYLGQLTELAKKAHKTMSPDTEPPPTAVYDTDAPMEQVAEFYAKEYGYNGVAPDATNNLSAAKPPAYYRTGDLAADAKGVEEILKKMNVPADVTKASGMYKAADITPRPNRPRVIVQRPYWDATTSQVVDRTLILMSRG